WSLARRLTSGRCLRSLIGGGCRRRRTGLGRCALSNRESGHHDESSSYSAKRSTIARKRNTQFWHKHGAVVVLWAAVASPLFYATCRRALGSLDGIRVHIGCVAQSRFL